MRAIYSYPSPAEVKIFINQNMWVDDVYRIDFNLTNQRTPLYDYTSQYFKEVAEGHSIVQGQLIINYRFPGYLRYAIEKRLTKDPKILRSLDEAAEAFRDLTQGSDAERIQKLLAYKRAGSFSYAKQIMSYNGDESEVKDTFNTTLTHSKLAFDIKISYGGTEALHSKTIEKCYIIGESQVISAAAIAGGDMSSSGMPIYEVYSFFGQRITDQITDRGIKLSNNTIRQSSSSGINNDLLIRGLL